MIPALSKTEKTKLAGIILGEISPSAVLFIILSRPQNTKELIALLGPFIPGDTLRAKIAYAFTATRTAFDSDARFREVAFGVLEKLRGVTDDEGEPVEVDGGAPASGITGQERGFLWKPVGENSGTLRVLLPEVWTGKVDRGSVELWRGGERIETLKSTGVANGNREHFQARKPGGAYNAGTSVRATESGRTWEWRIDKPGSRGENLTATRVGESVPQKPEPGQESEPEQQFSYTPGADSTTIYVQPSFGVWQLNIFSRRKHHTLYGPDRTTGPSWTIPMSGAQLKAASLAAGDDGSIMVFVNTSKELTGDNRNAAWRIMDPTKPQSGDGDRLKAGENR